MDACVGRMGAMSIENGWSEMRQARNSFSPWKSQSEPPNSLITAYATLEAGFRRWIASGACQSQSGAYCAWRDAAHGALAFEYPEITGYVLTYFAGLDELTAHERLAGRRAAEWLLTRLCRGRYAARDGWDGGGIYLFDLAMIATGLLAFGRRLQEERYLAGGLRLVDKIAREALCEVGPRALSPASPTTSRAPSWSTVGQAHLLKIVQCLLYADHLGIVSAGSAAHTLIGYAASLQEDNGRFITQPDSGFTMLHPHLYAIEGLWMWGCARADEQALARARCAANWLWAHQLPTGGFPRLVVTSRSRWEAPKLGEQIEQMDVTSQAVRMAIALHLDHPGIPRALRRLARVAQHDSQNGSALPYQPMSADRHLNTWTTLFGAQAVKLVSHELSALTWQRLV